ncbi:uncharacterized protein M421DRAFT_9655 [Didymella exigua CBS 183.55]|uniref:Uncharacterized protein n=1 Tax=Didymella exigua CBS 183.55 TaxID=1150837 RepID=A0A6A5R875_9PLEO|nr:uncharacterized protein M421DRAFT_9655 [Didymella exigua CBS 183.55]KAF1923420.1 hypothetical protein M421DRAFT_9655 [Didymella exigua CBS 183.55]
MPSAKRNASSARRLSLAKRQRTVDPPVDPLEGTSGYDSEEGSNNQVDGGQDADHEDKDEHENEEDDSELAPITPKRSGQAARGSKDQEKKHPKKGKKKAAPIKVGAARKEVCGGCALRFNAGLINGICHDRLDSNSERCVECGTHSCSILHKNSVVPVHAVINARRNPELTSCEIEVFVERSRTALEQYPPIPRNPPKGKARPKATAPPATPQSTNSSLILTRASASRLSGDPATLDQPFGLVLLPLS